MNGMQRFEYIITKYEYKKIRSSKKCADVTMCYDC